MTPALLLAIDPATSCGWATFVSGRLIEHRVHLLSKPDDRPGRRFRRLRDLIGAWIDAGRQARYSTREMLVAYEVAPFGRGKEVFSAQGLRAHIVSTCEDHRVACVPIHVSKVKLYGAGTGGADKLQMVAAVATRWGLDPETLDHNAADAIAVGETALRARAPN